MAARQLKIDDCNNSDTTENNYLPPIKDCSRVEQAKKTRKYHAENMKAFFENDPRAFHFEDYVAHASMTYDEYRKACKDSAEFKDTVERMRPKLYSRIRRGYDNGDIKSHFAGQQLHHYSPFYKEALKELNEINFALDVKKEFEKFKSELNKTTLQLAHDLKLFDATTEDALKRFGLKA